MSTRSDRKERVRGRRRKTLLVVALAAVGVVALTAAAFAVFRQRSAPQQEAPLRSAVVSSTPEVTAEAPSPVLTEVPDVVGKPLAQAEMLLSFAGFDIERQVVATAAADQDRTVLDQEPPAGERIEPGATVTLMHKPATVTATKDQQRHYVVCIDPGHQSKSDMRPEAVGPGSSETKPRVSGGATGVNTGIPEYEIDLRIAMRLKARLEKAGVQVVMTRTSNDVSLSNVERSQIANKAGADLFVRVHADSNVDRNMTGISTLYPAKNKWTGAIAERSMRAAKLVQAAVVGATGAKDRGAVPRADITGFNWSKVPAILVECGFLSNPAEDKLLSTVAYQDKLADGMARGVLSYLEGE